MNQAARRIARSVLMRSLDIPEASPYNPHLYDLIGYPVGIRPHGMPAASFDHPAWCVHHRPSLFCTTSVDSTRGCQEEWPIDRQQQCSRRMELSATSHCPVARASLRRRSQVVRRWSAKPLSRVRLLASPPHAKAGTSRTTLGWFGAQGEWPAVDHAATRRPAATCRAVGRWPPAHSRA